MGGKGCSENVDYAVAVTNYTYKCKNPFTVQPSLVKSPYALLHPFWRHLVWVKQYHKLKTTLKYWSHSSYCSNAIDLLRGNVHKLEPHSSRLELLRVSISTLQYTNPLCRMHQMATLSEMLAHIMTASRVLSSIRREEESESQDPAVRDAHSKHRQLTSPWTQSSNGGA